MSKSSFAQESKSFAQELIALGQQLTDENNAAGQLWTWLPSYKVAEKYHGDYVAEFSPSVKDVMKEAAMYF